MLRMPVLFVGHGSPTNALEDNAWTRSWSDLGRTISPPRAILSVSAHWYVDGTYVTTNDHPPTIHDFGGFPRPLYEIEYPAPGDATVARRVETLLDGVAAPDQGWGLDHGTWSVLKHMYPDANVPVVQLSIDASLSPSDCVRIGEHLAPLRDEGVLLMGSGSVTHNLRHAFASLQRGDDTTAPWAEAFDRDLARALEQRDRTFLLHALTSDNGRRSHPTPDHYVPLLYIFGASGEADRARFPTTGWWHSLSMRAVVYDSCF